VSGVFGIVFLASLGWPLLVRPNRAQCQRSIIAELNDFPSGERQRARFVNAAAERLGHDKNFSAAMLSFHSEPLARHNAGKCAFHHPFAGDRTSSNG